MLSDALQEVKRRWLLLDADNDTRGKIRLLRSLDREGPEMDALCELMMGLHLTRSETAPQGIGTFQRGGGEGEAI